MKNRFTLGVLAVGMLSLCVLGACGNHQEEVYEEFSFYAMLANGAKTLNKGDELNITISESGGPKNVSRSYTYVSDHPDIATVNEYGVITALKEGNVRISVTESVSGLSQTLSLQITDADPAAGGYNYASLAGETAVTKRTEILGKLEKYAMDNHLTGITLFENGGYVKYSERVKLPTTEYITGYGFGLLSEGELTADMPAENEEEAAYRRYLHSATSSDPKMINSRNDTGSQVSSLEGYITSSFWGTKLNSTKDKYEWYPVLAKDKVTYDGVDYDFNRPTPIYQGQEVKPGQEPNPLGLYNTWRIYVKTGAADGIKYRYSGTSWGDGAENTFDGRNVVKEDYEFAYRLLLTQSHKLKRGAEAAGDQTYGIVGAQRYYNNTEDKDDDQALAEWNKMKANGQLGIQVGTDETNGDYIQLTILNPIDRFTAMYTFSSSLYSPLPEDFFKAIGSGSVKKGAPMYGTFNNDATKAPAGHVDKILDYTLSVGPYMLEKWEKGQTIIFKRNAQWDWEEGRYNIAGVKLIVIDASTSSTAIYNRFNSGDLDSCGIPTIPEIIAKEVGQLRVYKTKGDATFKLNVNSCTQETWNELFSVGGKINKEGSNWAVKPWMSNDNFLNGLFFSIDRKTFASNRGMQPSIDYFSNAYLSDPENGKSYNDTPEHKAAIADYQTYDSDGKETYGYNKDKAILYFKTAVKELLATCKSDVFHFGTKENPFEIKIHIRWMYATDITEYGAEIGKYFTDAFNDDRVCGGKIKLVVEQEAVKDWQQVYNEYLMKGQFDLGFGAISGNTYNPLNFLEVLKSDNSSGFTLNWGTDTSKITKAKPLIYEGKMWSFDALWAVADHGGVVDNGSIAKTVKTCYVDANKEALYNGGTFEVAIKFVDSASAKFEVTRVQIYIFGYGGVDVPAPLQTRIENGMVIITITLPKDGAEGVEFAGTYIDNTMRKANKVDDPDKRTYVAHPFVLSKYGKFWNIDVSYSISIKPEGSSEYGAPSESYVTAAKNSEAWIDDQEVRI